MLKLTAAPDDDDRRLDRVLRKALPELPLSALHRLFRQKKITVDGKVASPETRVKQGQVIEVRSEQGAGSSEQRTMNKEVTTAPSSLFPVHCSLFPELIIYEGNGLLVINKPCGLAVHGPDSLNDQVLAYLEPKLAHSLSFKPGPLHRLDKPSSGLIVFSTNLAGARTFSAMLRNHEICKYYLAIVDGTVKKDEYWEDELVRDHTQQKTMPEGPKAGTGKSARTRVTSLATSQRHSLILAEIETGRTHQIRAQAALHGHPLSGDIKYGGKKLPGTRGFFLHAWKLQFKNKSLALMPDEFMAPLPEEFTKKIIDLFGKETLTKNAKIPRSQ